MSEGQFDVARDGNLFPREELLGAVAGADWRERPVPAAALLLLGGALAVLSLAAPLALPRDAAGVELTARGAWSALHLPSLLARAVHVAGMNVERSAYLVSALGLGLSLPALYLAARALRVGPLLALTAAALVALTPFTFGHGTSSLTWGVAAAALVVAAVLWRGEERAGDRARRGLVALAIGVWLHPATAALAPPVALALLDEDGPDRPPRTAVLAGTVGVVLYALLSNVARSGDLAGPASPLSSPAPADAASAVSALAGIVGVVVVVGGLFQLFRGGADEEEAAPRWLPFALVVAVLLAVFFDQQSPALPALAAVGLANLVNRRTDPAPAGVLALGALVLLAAGSVTLRFLPPPRAVVTVDRALGEGTSIDPERAAADLPAIRYLLQFRHGRDPAEVLDG